MSDSPSSPSQRLLLEQLAQQIRRLERPTAVRSAGGPSLRGPSLRDPSPRGLPFPEPPQHKPTQPEPTSASPLAQEGDERDHVRTTGIESLDQLLLDRGVPRGCVMEWLPAGRGGGVETLALWAAIRARRPGEFLVVIDMAGDFYVPGAVRLGWDDRAVVVRPRHPADALWTLEQTLRTPGAGVVICAWDRLRSTAFRRLQLAAEQGGCLGMLLRPGRVRSEPSFAEARWWVEPLPAHHESSPCPDGSSYPDTIRRWRVELLRARRQVGGGVSKLELELRDDNDRLRLVSPLVPATARRAAQ